MRLDATISRVVKTNKFGRLVFVFFCVMLSNIAVSGIALGLSADPSADEVLVTDCAGVPRLQQVLARGSTLELRVAKPSSRDGLTLTRLGGSGDPKILIPAVRDNSIIFSPLTAGAWKLCDAQNSNVTADSLALLEIREDSSVATLGIASLLAAGGSIVAVTASGSSGSDRSSAGASELSSNVNSQGSPSASGGSQQPAAGETFDPNDYPLGAEGVPLSPYR